jgi:branched-chain amino acid transport system ATP-binding protein
MGPQLECKNVSKFYGGLAAVRDLSFSVMPGEIYGIAGPNGAGKTTLFDVITGHATITSGEIYLNNQSIHKLKSFEIFRKGISRTFQIPVSFHSQTVLMNAFVGAQFGRGLKSLGNLISFPEDITNEALHALEFVGLGEKINQPSSNLSLFDKKLLMLATALANKPTILLLDEPVGGLNTKEILKFMNLVREVSSYGVTIIIIEHVMKVLMELSDKVLFMHYGEKIFEGIPEEASRDTQVLKVYLGEKFVLSKRPNGDND